MKILMQMRTNANTVPGGDVIQMRKTKDYLMSLGVHVDVNLDPEPNLDRYDIVHLFNITRIWDTYIQFRNAKRDCKPVVLSPIYHPKASLELYDSMAFEGYHKFIIHLLSNYELRRLFREIYYLLDDCKITKIPGYLLTILREGYSNMQKEVLQKADMLLPATHMEAESIGEDFSINDLKYKKIPFGVDIDKNYLTKNGNEFIKKYKVNDFVIVPGRIEPRKNQVTLLQVLKRLRNIPCVFAGRLNKHHKHYVNQFLKLIESEERFQYIGHISQMELFSAYAAAKIVALPSWMETSGLVGMEGAIMKCNVVITDVGYTKEIFRDYAYYIKPYDQQSIEKAILKAYREPYNPQLRDKLIEEYTWEAAAKETLKAYKEVLEGVQ